MRHRNVHPSIFVEIHNVNSNRRCKTGFIKQRSAFELSFAGIDVDERSAAGTRNNKVDSAIAVAV